MTSITVPNFLAFTGGIIVFLLGVQINRQFTFLREYNIPEPVTGGLIAATITFIIYLVFNLEVNYELETRNLLLVYFFTTIGLNARFSDLIAGGRPLIILLILTLLFIVVQNIVGVTSAKMLGLPTQIGVLAGSASLIGGHGTAIAWAPEIAQQGITNALEIGVAAATLGLVVASLIGGPIAKFLIQKYKLTSNQQEDIVGVPYENEQVETMNHLNFMSVMLVLHISILLGWFANQIVISWGFKLPLFVTCLLCAIVLSNTVPKILPSIRWPARTPALAVVSDFSLGIFLAMSLMSMQLWTIAGLAGPLLIILAMQTIAAITFILLILFPLMGSDYQAAVLSAGFGGFTLGATPTAIANMTAVTKSNGPAPLAFIILPLVAAFFVDVTNAFVIRAAINF